MAVSADPCVAEALSDLNLFYIRQIGASLKKVSCFFGIVILFLRIKLSH